MIRPIDIKLNAAHPELPLVEATTFTGAPSSVFIRGVPKSVGNWSITAVYVAVTYPDNTTTTRAAVESAEGVWVATIPGTATSGRTVAGFRILADGIDENGAAVTGYVLGYADFAVLSFLPVPAPGETFFYLRYFDTMPTTAKKMDVTTIDGILKYYNGTTWLPFAAYDDAVTRTSANGVKSSGIWATVWGALTEALPTGFSSLYDWCVAQLAGKASKSDVDPLLFAQYYPDGSVKSAAEFTSGIKYGSFDTINRTVSVLPFCNTGTAANDNSGLSGRVVIPPFVDASGNPYISDDGTRCKVVEIEGEYGGDEDNNSLTSIVVPTTVTEVGEYAFAGCASLVSASFPSVTSIGESVFGYCTSLASMSLPAVTGIGYGAFQSCDHLASVSLPAVSNIGEFAFGQCTQLTTVSVPAAADIGESAFQSCDHLASVSLPAATTIGGGAFSDCTLLSSVDFGDTPRSSVPSLGEGAFNGVRSNCTIIVPYAQYDEWKAASEWSSLPQEFVRHAEKADKPATFTEGNLAKFDSNGNPVDSGKKPSDFQSALSTQQLANIAAVPNKADASDIPYNLGTKTISNNAVTLDDRASNAVTISATLSPNTLTINFPTAPTGKLRDFAMRLNIAAGVTAPEIAWPRGVTLENNGGEVPEIADGGTGGSSTILYFSETENNGTTAKFLVKGETLTAIAQA